MASANIILRVIGHFHYIFLHFPLAFSVLLPFLEAIPQEKLGEKSRNTFWIVTLLFFVLSAATGLVRASLFAADAPDWSSIYLHRNLNLAAFLLCFASFWYVKRWRKEGTNLKLRVVLPAVVCLLVLTASYFGGQVAFGPWMAK